MESAENIDRSQTLSAGPATVILVAYFIPAIFLGFMLGMVGGGPFVPFMGCLLQIVGCAVIVFLGFALIPRDLTNTGPTGAAWVAGGSDGIMKGLVLGAFLGLGPLLLDQVYHPHPVHEQHMTEPIYHMLIHPGIQQLAAIISLMVLAPVPEELIFRGVLYGGYRKSFGPLCAAFVTTVLFVAIHFPYYIYAPVHVLPYVVVSLALLWCRLKWSAIGPAIAAHAGYNLIVGVIPSIHWTLRHYSSF